MEKWKSPKRFIAVLPSEIIEIPQDSDKSWLTLFYILPRELAEKWKPSYDLPRCPYKVLRTDKHDNIVCDDMFQLLVWDCYAWSAWQFFQVKDRKGNYRDIPGAWTQYAGYFPLWRLSYSIIPYIRMKFEQNGLGFQNLYNIPQGVEVPWLTYQQFSNLIGNVTDMVVAEQEWQPVIDAIWENRTVGDYETTSSTVKTDFMRKWHHNRSSKPISLDEMMESEDRNIFDVADPRSDFENSVISEMQIPSFAESTITEKDREILKLRMEGHTEQEIADKVGYKTALRSGGLPGFFTYAALGNGTFSTLGVPSGLAVIRVRQPFWTISRTLWSWLMSQTRLSFRFFTDSIDAPPCFGSDTHHLHFSTQRRQKDRHNTFQTICPWNARVGRTRLVLLVLS